MPRRLLKLEIDRVDLVDKGANPKASIVLAKRHVSKDSPAVGDVHVDTTECKCATCMAKEKSMSQKFLKGLYELFKSEGVEIEEPEAVAVVPAVVKAAEMDAEIKKRLDDFEKRATDAEAVAKSAVTMAKAESDRRLDSEMREVLKGFKATPFNLDAAKEDNDVKKFRKMQDADPDNFARVMEILKASDAQMATSLAFQTIGKNGAVAGSAEAQLVAKASEIRKSDTKLTTEAAFAQACEDNPGLTRQYRAEQH